MSGRRDNTRRSGFGLLLLAIGRTSGFRYFGKNTDAYLASLAPLLALGLVCGGLAALRAPREAATLFLLWLCVVLAPGVIAEPFCRRWGCMTGWALYANIMNWSLLLLFILAFGVAALLQVLMQAGAAASPALAGIRLLFSLYTLWFQYFTARFALGISRKRAALLLAATLVFNLLLFVVLTYFSNEPVMLQIEGK